MSASARVLRYEFPRAPCAWLSATQAAQMRTSSAFSRSKPRRRPAKRGEPGAVSRSQAAHGCSVMRALWASVSIMLSLEVEAAVIPTHLVARIAAWT